MDNFLDGDIVCLKCGGPEMTIVTLTFLYDSDIDLLTPCAYCICEVGHRLHENTLPLYALDVVRRNRRRAFRTASTYTAACECSANEGRLKA